VRPALARVVERCTAKQREERFQSALEVAEALQTVSSAELPAPRRPGRWPLRAAMGVVLVLAIGATALVVSRLMRVPAGRESAAADTLRTAAPVIAVLPFEVSGPGDSTQLARSAARLLTNALSTGFQVATVDVNRFLSQWTSERRTLGAPLDSNAAFAYRLGANQVVFGSSVEAGGQVRLSVDVYDTRDLGRLGHAEQTGRADSLFALMDRLAGAVAHVFCQRPAFNPGNLCFDVAARPAQPVVVNVTGASPSTPPRVDVLVTRSGTLGDVRPGTATPEVLAAALPVLQTARYVPARKNGQSTDAWADVPVTVRQAVPVVAAAPAPAVVPSSSATDCADPRVSLQNTGGRCYDARPAPRAPPTLLPPSSCGTGVGAVQVLVRVSAAGDVETSPAVVRGSGCGAFDQMAQAFVPDVAFMPATKAGAAVVAWVLVNVRPAPQRGGGRP
jgi:TolB-like protein